MKKHIIVDGKLVKVPQVELKEHETKKYKIRRTNYGWTIMKKGKFEFCDTVFIGDDDHIKSMQEFNEKCLQWFEFELIEAKPE